MRDFLYEGAIPAAAARAPLTPFCVDSGTQIWKGDNDWRRWEGAAADCMKGGREGEKGRGIQCCLNKNPERMKGKRHTVKAGEGAKGQKPVLAR